MLGIRITASFLVSFVAVYLAISLVSVTGVWVHDFGHILDNLEAAAIFCLPNVFFGRKKFRVSAILGYSAVWLLVFLAVPYGPFPQHLRLFWPIWVTLTVVTAANIWAYSPTVKLLQNQMHVHNEEAA